MRKFFKAILTYGLGEILTRGAQILILPLIFIYIDKTQFGKLDYFLSIKNILAVLMGIGLITSITRYSIEAENNDLSELVTNSITIILVLGTSLGLLIYLIAQIILQRQNFIEYQEALILTISISLINALITVPQAVLRTKKKPVKYSLINLITFIGYALLSFLFLTFYQRSYSSFLYANLISLILSFTIGMFLIDERITFKINFTLVHKLLKFGFAILASSLTFTLLIYSNRFFLKLTGDFNELGILGMAARVSLGVGALFVLPFNLAWLPFINDIFKTQNFKQIIQKVYHIYMLLSIILAGSISFFSFDLFKIIHQETYVDSVYIIPFFAFSYLFLGLYFIFAGGIYLSEKTSQYLKASIYTIIFNLILYLIFYQHYTLFSVSLITLVSHIVLFLLAFKYGNKILCIKLFDKNLLIVLLIASINIFLSLVLIYFNIPSIASAFLKLIILAVLSLIGIKYINRGNKFELSKTFNF